MHFSRNLATLRQSLRITNSSLLWRKRCSLASLGLEKGDDVVVAMSGGVDSSVALRLLADLDLNLSAVFMRNWLPDQSESPLDSSSTRRTPEACEWEKDYEDVQRVCRQVGGVQLKAELLDLSNDYWMRVFEPAVGIWNEGGTPNPDVACNSEIKFGALLDRLPSRSQYLATGHYAKVERSNNRTRLLRCRDSTKDQTYYLSSVKERQIARAVFPLADLTKREVRELALSYRLHTADRPESMGVCFIGERGRFGDFVSQYTSGAGEGSLIDESGRVLLEQHRGLWNYTVGQRARIAGLPGRWFVARKGVGLMQNDILVVPGGHHPLLQCTQVRVRGGTFSWIWPEHADPRRLGGAGRLVNVQIRHRMSPVRARVRVDSASDYDVVVTFDEPVIAVATGQVVALWDEDWCLGSGVITQTVCVGG